MEENKKLKTVHSDKVRVGISFEKRMDYLTTPTRDFSVNELVVSNLLRSCEVKMGIACAEKRLADSNVIKDSEGKRLVFIGDIANFRQEGTHTNVEFLMLTAVGVEVGDVITPMEASISNLVAETWEENFALFDFGTLSGKVLLGTTVMFSANVMFTGDQPHLSSIKVIEFGLRLFNDNSTVAGLATLTEDVDTYNYEYYQVTKGNVIANEFRNTALDGYFWKYGESREQRNLYKAAEYIIGSYDDKAKHYKDVVMGIARVVEDE